jgi:hypothetical protein
MLASVIIKLMAKHDRLEKIIPASKVFMWGQNQSSGALIKYIFRLV